jgi:aldose 1-epimerase
MEIASDGTILRSFQLCNNGITVVISTVGAAIQSIHVPNYSSCSTESTDTTTNTTSSNIVLGHTSPKSMYESSNPSYLGVIVGRVANRIQQGTFTLNDLTNYTLDINNSPNHLHGGNVGFSHAVWKVKNKQDYIIPTTTYDDDTNDTTASTTTDDTMVILTHDSPHLDSGYPASIQVQATYRLLSLPSQGQGATLSLTMTGRLTRSNEEQLSTPLNLAQHSYFNLTGNETPTGILTQVLQLPSTHYTPNDETSIPTRIVAPIPVSRNLQSPTPLSEILLTWKIHGGDLSIPTQISPPSETIPINEEPHGMDHNFVILRSPSDPTTMAVAGVISCPTTNRRLTVTTTAPGVQVYTGNWLPKQWQGMCLETQHYPSSIMTEVECQQYPDFSLGKCFILRPGGEDYHHVVEYHIGPNES